MRQNKRLWVTGACLIAAMAAVFFFASVLFEQSERQKAEARLSLYHTTLTDTLHRYRHLPDVLAKTQMIRSGALGIGLERINQRLADITAQTDLEAIYLMDDTGMTIAASNYANDVSFIGQNYGFRPYFQDALDGKQTGFFAIGVTTNRPGYFLAAPVYDHRQQVSGVIAIKVDLTALTRVWRDAGELLFVTNPDQITVLSSVPDWEYQSLTDISPETRAEIDAGRQFANEPLHALSWRKSNDDSARLDGRSYVHLTRDLGEPPWVLHFLVPKSQVWLNAAATLGAAGIVGLLLIALGLFLRARRIKSALTISQAERRKLRAANAALNRQIEERRAAERRAEKAQAELQQANKLAALGQLSASVTHELGQPISAMKNFLTAAEFGATEGETTLINQISRLVRRMESITRELRFFARPSPSKLEAVSASDLWAGTHELLEADIKSADVALTVSLPEEPAYVRGNRHRLEQVLVNLVKNALLAVLESGDKQIDVAFAKNESWLNITVSDHGPGLGGRTISDLREPFHTTRASGEGMGLGLAISAAIISEHQGKFLAKDGENGAIFTVSLPLAEAPSSTDAPSEPNAETTLGTQ
ncbi:cache domain-containing protein [Halocynthiibacter sp. C4]|uniref:sensor histidine kinase n=1 Tax=Halocynthiibacter sp. C4 TaxID=2992758 RepID=UPI00237B81C5|nr:ATP-binding protein [Halocynthiibacter sp. C4]MDE0589495.1 cache domain-containing protein [Halocynthiibacter sp. C4]